jgi:hypothetical protein
MIAIMSILRNHPYICITMFTCEKSIRIIYTIGTRFHKRKCILANAHFHYTKTMQNRVMNFLLESVILKVFQHAWEYSRLKEEGKNESNSCELNAIRLDCKRNKLNKSDHFLSHSKVSCQAPTCHTRNRGIKYNVGSCVNQHNSDVAKQLQI